MMTNDAGTKWQKSVDNQKRDLAIIFLIEFKTLNLIKSLKTR